MSAEVECVTLLLGLASFLPLSVQKPLSPLNRDLVQADAVVTGPGTQVDTGEMGQAG